MGTDRVELMDKQLSAVAELLRASVAGHAAIVAADMQRTSVQLAMKFAYAEELQLAEAKRIAAGYSIDAAASALAAKRVQAVCRYCGGGNVVKNIRGDRVCAACGAPSNGR